MSVKPAGGVSIQISYRAKAAAGSVSGASETALLFLSDIHGCMAQQCSREVHNGDGKVTDKLWADCALCAAAAAATWGLGALSPSRESPAALRSLCKPLVPFVHTKAARSSSASRVRHPDSHALPCVTPSHSHSQAAQYSSSQQRRGTAQ